MGRTVRLTNRADTFTQGLSANNVEINLFTLGGNDRVNLNRSDDLGGGNTVNTGKGNDVVINLKESGNIILLGDGNDTYVGRGFGSFSTDPFDQVFAGKGADTIAVETFQSRYFGEAGNDTFFSVGWQNVFHGGTGTDTISYAPRDDDSTQGGSTVVINLGAGTVRTGASRIETLISIENATGSGANDTIIGSSGANRLEGSGGLDQLAGLAGADRFVFAQAEHSPVAPDGIDLITDFSSAEGDRIDVSGIDAKTGAGNQAFTFIGTGDFTGAKGQLRIEVLPGEGLILTGDVNGDSVADFRIGLLNLTTLVASDLIL
jgi:serralysin